MAMANSKKQYQWQKAISITMAKNNPNTKSQYKKSYHKGTNIIKKQKLCAFVPLWQKPKNLYLQNDISNRRNRFSWRTFIASFN